MKLKYCVILTVVTFLLLFSEVFVLWLPLAGVIQSLSASDKVTQVPVPWIWHILSNWWFGMLISALAFASVICTKNGLRRETGDKAGWVVNYVFAAIALLIAVNLPIALSRLQVYFYPLGIK